MYGNWCLNDWEDPAEGQSLGPEFSLIFFAIQERDVGVGEGVSGYISWGGNSSR